MITTILLFIIVLGLLIFVHELGHYLVAVRNGVKAEEFGFGFPPRLVGTVKNDVTGKYEIVWGNKNIEAKNTVFSLNWIPLGGFVKMKGENKDTSTDADNFHSQAAWPRVKILSAGVLMNFLLAWVIFAIVYMVGAPQEVNPGLRNEYTNVQVQLTSVEPGSPADTMGLKPFDALQSIAGTPIATLTDVSGTITRQSGQSSEFVVKRGEDILTLSGTPRTTVTPGQGAYGFSYAEVGLRQLPWYEAVGVGFERVIEMIGAILVGLGALIWSLLTGGKVVAEVAGPVGIAGYVRDFADMGWVFLAQFTAMLSVNLGVINALPIPALDGGRILMIGVEKLRGRAVSEKFELYFHGLGFVALIGLMIWVTVLDLSKFNLGEKFMGLF